MTNLERSEILMESAETIGDYRKALDEAEKRGVDSLCRRCKHAVWACNNGCPEDFLSGSEQDGAG